MTLLRRVDALRVSTTLFDTEATEWRPQDRVPAPETQESEGPEWPAAVPCTGSSGRRHAPHCRGRMAAPWGPGGGGSAGGGGLALAVQPVCPRSRPWLKEGLPGEVRVTLNTTLSWGISVSRAAVGKLRPAGQIRPV
uniref:Uncharacterized protein n=1 Tax=Myotis myotis TaxID=51298 RepID=A0A7J7RKI3_MYOMY|nr:hypothetical protein mMyoMyo1_010293 [Myotis myotis]